MVENIQGGKFLSIGCSWADLLPTLYSFFFSFYISYYEGLDVIQWHFDPNAMNENRDALHLDFKFL